MEREELIRELEKRIRFAAGGTTPVHADVLMAALDLLKEREAVVLCKDCKHRPKEPNFETYESGFDIEFPEGSKCPCQCDDGYYSWYPNDDWFCANGERSS